LILKAALGGKLRQAILKRVKHNILPGKCSLRGLREDVMKKGGRKRRKRSVGLAVEGRRGNKTKRWPGGLLEGRRNNKKGGPRKQVRSTGQIPRWAY